MAYAKGTAVSPEKSRMEIEKMLRRAGAGQFVSGWDQDKAVIGFSMRGRQVRFTLVLPTQESCQTTGTGRVRRETRSIEKAWEQACAERWRCLALVIKAKLEAVASGIEAFEDAFLANTVLPGGGTFGQWAQPQLDAVYANGEMPRLLSGG